MIPQFFLDQRPHKGLTYEEYLSLMQQHSEDPSIENFETIKLNQQRTSRINKTYNVGQALKDMIAKITSHQLWMVITEDWCGDSAQNVPYVAKIAACNPLIDLRILLRDKNLDIMDLYLTEGKSRSIPKLVIFDKDGNELVQWGPRPAAAQALVNKNKSEGIPKDEFIKDLHLWYGRNRGENLEEEFEKIIGQLINQ
ncbi:MAG: thioredoxin family protein [Bacteroidetes bacterium]|nr:thioredoxin family protein [Bacteroidota bacterium]